MARRRRSSTPPLRCYVVRQIDNLGLHAGAPGRMGHRRVAHGRTRALHRVLLLSCLAALPGLPLRAAAPRSVTFTPCAIATPGQSQLWVDLTGDGRLDLCLLQQRELRLFRQRPESGFAAEPDRTWPLPSLAPCVLWHAILTEAGPARLLILTATGVAELVLPEGEGPLTCRPLLARRTVLPEAGSGEPTFFPFALAGPPGVPSVLVLPEPDAVSGWAPDAAGAYLPLGRLAVDLPRQLAGPDPLAVYRQLTTYTAEPADLNRDGLEDILISGRAANGDTCFSGFLQRQTPPRLATRPDFSLALPLTDMECVQFVPRAPGTLPLVIRAQNPKEPWLLPGTFSPKVLVRLYTLEPQTGALGAEPVATFRKSDWSPWTPAADIDGDGEPDLVLGYLRFRGRDDIVNLIRTCSMGLSLRTHRHAAAGYASEPDAEREVTLSVERVQFQFGFDKMASLVRRYLSLDGDFDGDGRRDLLLRHSDDGISIFTYEPRRGDFSQRPTQRLRVENATELLVRDLNGDGVSDLVVPCRGRPLLVFLSSVRGGRP